MNRVCLGSNVLVAAFASRGLCADVLRLSLSNFDLVVPELVRDEVRRVLREKLKVSDAALATVESLFQRCEIAPRSSEPPPVLIRDPDDERILADAVAAGVRLFATGDADVLAAAAESPIPILSPRAFLTLLHGGTL